MCDFGLDACDFELKACGHATSTSSCVSSAGVHRLCEVAHRLNMIMGMGCLVPSTTVNKEILVCDIWLGLCWA